MKLPIAQPPWTRLGRQLESAFRKALYDYQLITDERIAIALSGGKDSLTLLYLLSAISGRGFPKLDLMAIHINGAYTCGASISEDFLRAICAKLGVKFHLETQSEAKQQGCYPCSRERRRLIFAAAKSLGYTTIAFGHHQDDFTQTLLMNLLHKGEFATNLPKIEMLHYGVTLIRPLLYITERDILNFAVQEGFHRVVCKCPLGQNSMRKKTDHLLSYLEKQFPNARTNLALAGRLYGSTKAEKP